MSARAVHGRNSGASATINDASASRFMKNLLYFRRSGARDERLHQTYDFGMGRRSRRSRPRRVRPSLEIPLHELNRQFPPKPNTHSPKNRQLFLLPSMGECVCRTQSH